MDPSGEQDLDVTWWEGRRPHQHCTLHRNLLPVMVGEQEKPLHG